MNITISFTVPELHALRTGMAMSYENLSRQARLDLYGSAAGANAAGRACGKLFHELMVMQVREQHLRDHPPKDRESGP